MVVRVDFNLFDRGSDFGIFLVFEPAFESTSGGPSMLAVHLNSGRMDPCDSDAVLSFSMAVRVDFNFFERFFGFGLISEFESTIVSTSGGDSDAVLSFSTTNVLAVGGNSCSAGTVAEPGA